MKCLSPPSLKLSGVTTLLVVLSAFFLTACVAQYPLNPHVEKIDRETAYRAKLSDRDRDNELLMILAFSGGGTRAAALSYGVLEALDLVEIPPPESTKGQRHTLLDEVDLISSVSGGSFTAAYYGIHGRDIFNDFRREFLYRDYQGALMWGLANPVNWVLLASPRYGRSDLAQEYYDDNLFRGATMGDIAKKRGPAIIILATEATDGVSFSFTPSQFALICSDFDRFPVSRAVAASAAFPGAFSPIVMKNYSGTCDNRMPRWMEQSLAKPDITSRTYYNAKRMKTYLDPKRKPYIHLIDGGVSDNLGVRGFLDSLIARGGLREAMKEANLEKVRRAVVIIVDAQTQETAEWQTRGEVPGFATVLGASSTIMINKYNFETIELLNHVSREWSYYDETHGLRPIDFYIVHVAFDALPDLEEQDYFNRIPTSLYLPEEQVDRLRAVASSLLYNDKEFQKLVRDLGGRIPRASPALLRKESQPQSLPEQPVEWAEP